MKVFTELTRTDENTAVALGYFDGIHLAHKKIIDLTVAEKNNGLKPTVFTFKSTPKKEDECSQILTLQQRIEKLEKSGVEILYVIDFCEIKDYTPEDFVENIVKDVFNAKKVFCGFNYRFGKGGKGDSEKLKTLCGEENIETVITKPMINDGEIISSSLIRNYLLDGNIKKANELLGYNFSNKSVVVKGNQIGRTIGFPTINQQVEKNKIVPMYGVYKSQVVINDKVYKGITNIGVKPTVTSKKIPLWETWLPEYTGEDIYGKTVDVKLIDFIRKEKKFSDLQSLKNAIENDRKTAWG